MFCMNHIKLYENRNELRNIFHLMGSFPAFILKILEALIFTYNYFSIILGKNWLKLTQCYTICTHDPLSKTHDRAPPVIQDR